MGEHGRGPAIKCLGEEDQYLNCHGKYRDFHHEQGIDGLAMDILDLLFASVVDNIPPALPHETLHSENP
jgi:hypothetical protein